MKKFISIICVIFIITTLVSCDPKPTKETEVSVVSESVVETYEVIVSESLDESLDEEDERGF